MAITASAIAALVHRYRNDKIEKQALLSNKIVGEKVIETIKRPTSRGVVNIKAGGLSSTEFIADQGTLPTGQAVTPVQATYDPAYLLTRLAIPRGGATLAASTQDGIDLVFEQMESAGRDLGRTHGRAIFGDAFYTLASGDDVDASSDATITVADPSGFRVGMTFDVYNGASVREADQVVSAVAPPTSPTGNWTITLSANASATFVAGDDLYLSGAKDNGMLGLNDVTAAAALYSVSNTSNEWSGTLDSSTTTLTAPLLRSLMTKVQQRRGAKPSHVLVGPENEQRLYEAQNDGIRYINGKVDEYGLTMQFAGVPVFCDENCGSKDVYLFNKEDVKLHEFRPVGPDVDGDSKPGMGRGALLISDTKFEYDVQVWMASQLRVERRNGTGRMSGITA